MPFPVPIQTDEFYYWPLVSFLPLSLSELQCLVFPFPLPVEVSSEYLDRIERSIL